MADGLFYNDLREPFIAPTSARSRSPTTAKALYAASQFPVLGGQYFARIGKKLRIRLFGRMTTGADAGQRLVQRLLRHRRRRQRRAADDRHAGRAVGVADQPVVAGRGVRPLPLARLGRHAVLHRQGALQRRPHRLDAAADLLPASAPAVSGACDLTAALIISVQYLRSGSTVETMQVHDMEVQKALGTGTYLIRVDQPVQEFPYGAWTAHIDVRQLQTTNLNFPGLGSLTVLYPPAEAPITPADVSTWIHRARRRGRR
jgi:hypothetical protein